MKRGRPARSLLRAGVERAGGVPALRSLLDKRFQPLQRIVPLRGNLIEIRPQFPEMLRPEREQTLAPGADAAHYAGAFKDAKMLGDRLTRQL